MTDDYKKTLAYQLLQKFEHYRAEVEKYASVSEFCPIPCFVTAHDGLSILYVNPAYVAMTGCSIQDLQDYGWAKVIHPDDRKEAVDVWKRFLEDGNPAYVEQRYINAITGSITEVYTSVHAVKGNGFVGFMMPKKWDVMATGWYPRRDLHPQPAR